MKFLPKYTPLLLAIVAGNSFAEERDGIYIGGSILQSNIDASDDDIGVYGDYVYLDEYTTGFKILGGYYYGLTSKIDIGFEMDYREFGIIDGYNSQYYEEGETGETVIAENQYQQYVTTTRYRQDISALNFYGMIGFNLGKMGVFGKWGSSFNDSDIDESGGNLFKSGFSYTYGIGAKFQLGSVAVRSEYEVIDFKAHGGEYMYMFSVGGTVTF